MSLFVVPELLHDPVVYAKYLDAYVCCARGVDGKGVFGGDAERRNEAERFVCVSCRDGAVDHGFAGCGDVDRKRGFFIGSGEAFVESGKFASSCFDGGSFADAGRDAVQASGDGAPIVGEAGSRVESVGCSSTSVKGKNYEKNKMRRARRKLKLASPTGQKKFFSDVEDLSWRRGAGPVSRTGYFAGCASDVQEQLVSSRANMYIAKNKREEQRMLEEIKRNDVESKEYILKEMARVASMASNLRNKTKDTAVAGWAMTLAESVTRSAAESAPDSVPSLESVGYGKSALRSSDGSDGFVDAVRLREYKVKHDELTEYYEALDGYVPSEKEQSFRALKLDFADVSMSERDRMHAEVERDILDRMNAARVPVRYMDEVFPHLNILAC